MAFGASSPVGSSPARQRAARQSTPVNASQRQSTPVNVSQRQLAPASSLSHRPPATRRTISPAATIDGGGGSVDGAGGGGKVNRWGPVGAGGGRWGPVGGRWGAGAGPGETQ